MRRFIFNNIKKRIPKISDTERIALNCGTTSIDRELFEGKVKQHIILNFVVVEDMTFSHLPPFLVLFRNRLRTV